MNAKGAALGLVLAALVAASPLSAVADTPPAPTEPPIVTLVVPNDRDIEVVDGPRASREVLLYFHGFCGDPLAFRTWSATAARFGTLISLRGDEACPDAPGRSRWGYDHELADRRVSAAIAAVSAMRATKGKATLRADELTAIGYSQGARRVEWLAARFPKRYVRVALIAGAFKPSPEPLSRRGRFLIMAGAWDNRKHLFDATSELARAGLTVRYGELPRARHGEYGPNAMQAMHAGLEWLFNNVP